MRHSRARSLLVVVVVLIVAAVIVWRARGQNPAPSGELYGNGIIETTEVDVSAKVAGQITSLRVDEGDPVRANDVLAEHPDIARRLHASHVRFLEQLGTPEEFLAHRRQLVLP